MKRTISFLLALCLLGAVPAAASERPGISFRERGGNVELTLKGVEEHITAIQVEVVLDGNCPNAAFSPVSGDVYSPAPRVDVRDGKTTVSVYLVMDGMVSGSSLQLGTLTPGGDYRLPPQAGVTILDRGLRPLESIGQLPLTEDDNGSGFGGGNGSGNGSGGGSSGSTDISRRIRTADFLHGTVRAKPSDASAGTRVTLDVSPDSGYVLESIRVTDSRGRDVELEKAGWNRYSFQMPDRDVEIYAVFVPAEETAVLPFADIAPDAWCFDAVRYVYENGLMNGTSASTFTPNAATTRGMIVAILYRQEGSPDAGSAAFSDVNFSDYYASAVAWASSAGIVNGYADGTFRPNQPITREQMAAFLFRYAAYKGQAVSWRADLSAFADAPQIAAYAVEAIQWANAQGLVNGTSAVTLTPRGTATRAQVAVILTRFAQNILA